ncbi:MAG: ATP-binding protein [Acidimicrobiales bacterium]
MARLVSVTASYRPRMADGYLAELCAEFAAVMITGPRAVGKTTTAAQHAKQIVRLDQPGPAAAYRSDPDAALRRAGRPVLLDEWQEVPEVLAAVKRAVDQDSTPGQFVLTGSVRADLGNETWAGTGRVVRMGMYPLAERELRGVLDPERPSFLARLARTGADDLLVPPNPPNIDGYVALALRGGFPEVAYRVRTERARSTWLMSYLDDLVTRDAAALDSAKDPVKLRRYLTVLALNNAGVPSDVTLYQAADVNAKTAAGYDQLLRNLYVLDIVPAWASNRLSRLVKQGKRYLLDPGLAMAAAGLDVSTILSDGDLVGRCFDAFATAQLRPEIALSQPRPVLHHLRAEGGRREVDLVVELGAQRVIGLELKASSAPTKDDARHLSWLRQQLGRNFLAGVVIHSGPAVYELGERVYAVPLCALWS